MYQSIVILHFVKTVLVWYYKTSLHYYILFIITCNMVNKIDILYQNVSVLFLIDCTLLLSRSNSFIHVPMRYLISLKSLYLFVCDYVENPFLIIFDTRVIVLVKHYHVSTLWEDLLKYFMRQYSSFVVTKIFINFCHI